jgi:hypothetical protein
MQRRTLLSLTGAVGVSLGLPLPLLFARRAALPSALVPDPHGLIDLPPGFSYRILERTGQAMTDGYRVPWLPDGMGCFAARDGTWVLMRNHELTRFEQHGPRGRVPPESYDAEAFGCVTRLVIDPLSLHVRSSNLVLAGTLRNCSGGATPWGWLTCEEAVERAHGFVFLCSTSSMRVAAPMRIDAFGRFKHEAACLDPNTRITYLTEDREDGCLYRCVPDTPALPFTGRLQALRVPERPRYDIGSWLRAGDRMSIDWVDIESPNPKDDSVRSQAHERGAAVVRRGEGACWRDGSLYVCSTSGGPRGRGQILRVRPEPNALLELVAQVTDPEGLDMPDSITFSPWGDLYVAEDGAGDQFVRVLSAAGTWCDMARNARSSGEFAGICFAPDGRALFVNLQLEGLTVAITGPFSTFSR